MIVSAESGGGRDDTDRNALTLLGNDKFATFQKNWGGAVDRDREACVREFAYAGEKRHQYEQTIIYHLQRLGVEGLKTEDEKLAEVANQSASAAKESATAAKESARLAGLSLVVAIIAAAATIVAIGCDALSP